MRKPVLSARSRAMPKVLVNRENIYLCEPANAKAIADGIIALKENVELREELAANGEAIYHAYFSVDRIGADFYKHLKELV